MKKGLPMTSRATLRLIATALICTWLPAITWGASAPAGLFQLPLNQIPVPEPPNLFQFVKNKPAAIKLGKALFWDMQAGSDGVQACASCHFSAGVDKRLKNTLNPGSRAGDATFQVRSSATSPVRGPNDTLHLTDFPFHQRQNPAFQDSPILRDFNDVVGSQGVKLTDFLSLSTDGSAVDIGTPVTDTVFQVGGVNMRQVTARNTPSVINAVFNFNNFWDGRAHFTFNGVNPFGPQDTTAGVWFSDNTGNLTKRKIAIEMASLASQATGPPLDTTEMSFRGRTFPHLGRKMLSLTPLGKQLVHPKDSVLGPLSRAVLQPNGKTVGLNGLNTSYAQLIIDAFQDNLWNSNQLTPDGFIQMEANFSLFWGLAIQLYEATLVAGQTPFDQLLGGDPNALNAQEESGMNIFFGAGKCSVCHAGTELTSATASAALFVTNLNNALIDQMPVASGQDTIYDIGYNNTAVRPIADDIGRGGNSPFANPLSGLPVPLSFSAMAELQATGNLPFASIVLPDQIRVNFPVSNDGAFKVPGLRNVELTSPYFHDGSVMTLEDVVEFYIRGGNFPADNINHLDFNITELGALRRGDTADPDKVAALVAFMKTLTDQRVKNESAPFDHPELFVPNGDLPSGDTEFIRIPARDANGVPASTIAVTLNPVSSPTNLSSQTISGTKEAGSSVQVSINNGPAIPAASLTDTTWSATLTGLVEGTNTIGATATLGENVTVTGSIFLDITKPTLTINAVTTPTAVASQTLSGTVEAGITPVISVSSGATVGPVSISNGVWNTTITGLVGGFNGITVIAVDPAGNAAIKTAGVTYSIADGNFKGTGDVDISDALKAMRIAAGLVPATPLDLLHGDVAPLLNGVPAPDNNINVADALLILRKVAGLVSF